MRVPLLAVDRLAIDMVRNEGGTLPVVTDVSFTLQEGEILGIVGESGCGKTVTALAIMGLLPRIARVRSGSIRFKGQELIGCSKMSLERLRGREIAMIFQDASNSLDPAFSVGEQIAETARKHLMLSRKASWERAIEMLQIVGIRKARDRASDYPHMFSGGMCQRVMIATALVCDPAVLIADEPTTALDVTVQAQILRLLHRLHQDRGLSVILITHDLGVVAEMCDRVAVLYAGEVVEAASTHSLFLGPRHPYTEGLLRSIPRLHRRSEALAYISGSVPSPAAWPAGCRFHPRCPYADERCSVGAPALQSAGLKHETRCIRERELSLGGLNGQGAT